MSEAVKGVHDDHGRFLGRSDKVLEHHKRRLSIAQQIGDKAGEGRAYRELGICYYYLGQYGKALEHHKRNLDIAQEIGDKAGEGAAGSDLGNCYYFLRLYDKALEHHKLHLSSVQQIGDKAGEGLAHGNIGNCHYSLGQYRKAVEHQKLSLGIAQQIGDKDGEAASHGNLGSCYYSFGMYDKALEHHKLHLDIAQQIGDKAGEGRAYGNLGVCFESLGQYGKALEHHKLDLDIAHQIGDKAGESTAHGNLGKCYNSLGHYDKALEHHKLDLDIAQQIGDKAGEGRAYGNIGNCYHSLGQYDKALGHHNTRLSIAQQIGDKTGESTAYGNLGNCGQSLGQNDEAIEHHKRSLAIAQQIGYKVAESAAHCNLGNCYYSLKLYDKALEHHKVYLSSAQQIRDKAGEGRAYGNLGTCYQSLGQYDKALEHHKLSLDITQLIRDKAGEGRAYGNFGICYYFLEQYEKAENALRNCLNCREELFGSVPAVDEHKTSIRDIHIHAEKLLIWILILQNKKEEALLIAERGRSRALSELMLWLNTERMCEVERTTITAFRDVLEVVRLIDCTVLFFTVLDASQICTWAIQPSGEVEFKEITAKVAVPPNSTATTKPCSANCEDRSLSGLYVGGKRDVRQWTGKSFLEAVRAPAGFGESQTNEGEPSFYLEWPILNQIDNGITKDCHKADEQEKERCKQWYRTLLRPFRSLVKGSEVVVVPDGYLSLVPFAGLIGEDGRYVAESTRVRLVPSLATARMILRSRDERGKPEMTPLLVGDPELPASIDGETMEKLKLEQLPYARSEVEGIGKLLGTEPLTGPKATREGVLQRMANANLIHIAAHGNAERGVILLAPSPGIPGRDVKREEVLLTPSDLERKRLKAELVVLSCCHSGRGRVRAEGVISIARAFLGAGVRAVLMTVQAIDDRATLVFMEEFYKHLIGGAKASEALQKTMKTMMNRGDSHQPQFWAPFSLIGADVAPFAVGSGM